MSSLAPIPVGLRTAFTGICCVNCMESPKSLVLCSRCKFAKYCNKKCQTADWKVHKAECSLLKEFEETYDTLPGSTSFVKVANFKKMKLAQDTSLSPVKARMKWRRILKFLNYSRTCSVCLKHAHESPTKEKIDGWKCCSVCHFGWCCSKKHWDEYKDKHTSAICKTYVRSISIERFLYNHIKEHGMQLLALPPLPLPEAFERFPKNWEKYFRVRFGQRYDLHLKGMLPPEYFPASTMHLSQVASCLFAMYEFGIEKFKDKSTLCIHIVKPTAGYEVLPTCVWEEISHCLPNVKTLKTLFIGPEACVAIAPPTDCLPLSELECCPSCVAQGRKRMFGLYGYNYDDFCSRYLQEDTVDEVESLKPDLVVSFNPGIHEEDVSGWRRNVQLMLDMNVPTFFTAFNLSEGDADDAVLKAMNARMLYDFGPKKNPFFEMKPEIDSAWSEVDGFYHRNMYCMAFQGREE